MISFNIKIYSIKNSLWSRRHNIVYVYIGRFRKRSSLTKKEIFEIIILP